MFYDAHYLFPRPWTQAQEAPGVPAPAPVAFYGANTISQSFVSGANHLEMIEIWLEGPPYATVTATLSDEHGSLYEGLVFLPEQPHGRYYQLQFPAVQNAEGRTFTLTLQATGTDVTGPVITRTIGGDKVGGAVRLNEYGRPGNLELRTYVGGTAVVDALSEQLLPDLFRLRLQQFKPAAFKGNTFAVLFGLMVSLSLVFLVAARPSGQSLAQAVGWLVAGLLAGLLIWQIGDDRVQLPIPLLSGTVHMTEADSPRAAAAPNDLRIVNDMILALWTADRAPEERFIETTLDGLPAIHVPAASQLSYALDVPRHGRFTTQVYAQGDGALRFSILFNDDELAELTAVAGDPPQSVDIDLAHLAGQGGKLKLVTEPISGEAEGYWYQPQLLAQVDWLLPALPDAAQPVGHRLGEAVTLQGYSTHANDDDSLTVTLYWQTERPLTENRTVFVHLLDDSGAVIAQSDGQPVQNSYPLTVWPTSAIIADEHILPISEGAALAIGLYNPADGTRWPVINPDGSVDPDGRVLIPLAQNGQSSVDNFQLSMQELCCHREKIDRAKPPSCQEKKLCGSAASREIVKASPSTDHRLPVTEANS